MKTAGQLLAEMLQARERGQDTEELRDEFIKQSCKQLGNACTNFEIVDDKQNE